MLFVTNCEVNKNLSLYSNSSHIERAAETAAGLFNPGDTPVEPQRRPSSIQLHPSGTPETPGGTPTTSPERPGRHSGTSSYGSVKSPSMHYRSPYLSF